MIIAILAGLVGALIGFFISRYPQTRFADEVRAVKGPAKLIVGALFLGILGQFGRIPPLSGEILLADILVVLAAFWFGIELIFAKKKLVKSPNIYVLLAFFAYLVLALLASRVASSVGELLKGLVYAVRLISYLSIPLIMAASKIDRLWLIAILKKVMTAVVVLGFVQLLVFPDITVLNQYGWDPHIGRLVSTFLDPNFLGGYLALFVAVLFAEGMAGKKQVNWFLLMLVLVATILTYSRSGYLAVMLVVLVAGAVYSWRMLLVVLMIVVPGALAIPRVQERLAGAFSVDATSQARIDSWKVALEVTSLKPVTGVGYNLYGLAQEKLGIRKEGDVSRAANASDSSVLNIIATMGSLGIALVLALFSGLFDRIRKEWDSADVAKKIAARAIAFAFLGILANSFFVNALFYPLLLLPMMVLLSALYGGEQESDGTQKTRKQL